MGQAGAEFLLREKQAGEKERCRFFFDLRKKDWTIICVWEVTDFRLFLYKIPVAVRTKKQSNIQT